MSFNEIKKILATKGDFSHRWGTKVLTLNQLGKASASEYFFEFSFFLQLTKNLVTTLPGNWWVELPRKPPVAKSTYIWPLAPGLPDTFSFVSGVINGFEIEIRPGVEAAVPGHDTTVSPDISIRRPNAPDAVNNSVLRMWDAKYRTNSSNRISRQESFTFILENKKLLDIVEVANFNIQCGGLLAAAPIRASLLQNSSLVTNGQFSSTPDTLLATEGVGEVGKFNAPGLESYRGV